jgi:hypothetical protein
MPDAEHYTPRFGCKKRKEIARWGKILKIIHEEFFMSIFVKH